MAASEWREIGGTGVAREIGIVLQALDMTVPDGSGAYLAGPISTGRRYYEALARVGASTLDELIETIGEAEYLSAIRWPNVTEGERVAAELRRRGVPYLINTGPLMISGWRGSNYMELCFELIEKKVGVVYFHPEWAFSNGAAKEFLYCTRRGIACRHSDGEILTVEEARAVLSEACACLGRLSLNVEKFEQKLHELDALAARSGVSR